MKRELRALLAAGSVEEIGSMAEARPGVLGALVPFTYAPDPLLAWRAVEALGIAAARLAAHDPAPAREQLRRLLWLLSEESGGICWRAPQAMAEIVRRCPGPLADYVPIIVHLLVEMAEEDLAHFRPAILWAIGRLGPLAAAEVPAVLPQLEAALGHADSQVRGLAVRALLECGQAQLLADHPALLADGGAVQLFEEGRLASTTVAVLAARAPAAMVAGARALP